MAAGKIDILQVLFDKFPNLPIVDHTNQLELQNWFASLPKYKFLNDNLLQLAVDLDKRHEAVALLI